MAAKREPRWGTCPVCFHERRYDVNGEMKPHRKWVSPADSDHPYGHMVWCKGIGHKFLPPLTGTQIREYATK